MNNYAAIAGVFGYGSTALSGAQFLNRKALAAKAQFTTPRVEAPWLTAKTSDTALLLRANEIARSKSLIASTIGGSSTKLPSDPDLALSFATYGALDRLLTLAKAAADDKTGTLAREKLADRFGKGLDELSDYLAATHGEKLNVGFDRLKSTAVTLKAPLATADFAGKGISAQRADALTMLTGTEQISVTLSKGGRTDTVNVDLSTINGTITLDKLTDAINASIKSIPLLDSNGNPQLDGNGNAIPRYLSNFAVTKQSDGKWGLTLKGVETERVALADPLAAPALIVTSGLGTTDAPTSGRVVRFDSPEAGLSEKRLAELTAVDADATSMAAKLAKEKADAEYEKKVANAQKLGLPKPPRPEDVVKTVLAQMAPKATATDQYGNIFVVGTTSGDLGQQHNDGTPDLFLSKLDSEGNILWQRLIGTDGETRGAAIAVDANGDVVVAGTTEGSLVATDQIAGADSFVAKFTAGGEDVFTTQIDGAAIDEATSLAIDASGRIFLGGSVRGSLPNGTGIGEQDGYVVQLNATGQITARRQIGTAGSDQLSAMTVASDGSLLAVTYEDGVSMLRRLDATTLADLGGAVSLGAAKVTAIAVDKDSGRIAVGGTTLSDIEGATALNARSLGSDGFVAMMDADLGNASVRYFGTDATDSVDSLAFMGGKLYAGGRTGAVLGDSKVGRVDGFVARLDMAGGLEELRQFGQSGTTQEAVHVAASTAGSSVLGKLGLRGGDLSRQVPTKLIGQTSLREGDHFFLKIDGERKIRIDIKAGETFDELARRIRIATGNRMKATTTSSGGQISLSLGVRSNKNVDLIAGADGQDALSKLGLEPTRLYIPKASKGGNIIQPGGTYGLELDKSLAIDDKKSAQYVVKKLEAAVRTIQSAYRSLYWDDTKAQIASGLPANAASDPRLTAQMQAYRIALARLGG